MRHPIDGTLRRLLDEPAGVADTDREHVAGCEACRAALASAEHDAQAVGAALGADLAAVSATGLDIDRAWRRLTESLAADARSSAALPPARRWRGALRSPVVAACAVAALLTGAGVAAAADWLPIFRTERIAPFTIAPDDLVQLPDLSAFGELEVVDEVDVREVADAAAAEQATGLAVPRLDELPRGVVGEPEYHAAGQVSAEFTFSAKRAAATVDDAGGALPPPPAGLDGSRFRLVAGPGVALVWEEAHGVPALIVARAVAPTGYSSGVPFEEARDYLLTLPGLPDEVAAQLAGFSADGSTLPIPLVAPDGAVSTATVDVGGSPATVLELSDGALAAVVWVDAGVVTAVAGSMSADEVVAVARGLR